MREPSRWLKRCAKGRQHLQEMHAEQDRAHSCRVMLSGTEVAAGTTPSGAEQELQQLPGDRDELNRRKRGHTAKLVESLCQRSFLSEQTCSNGGRAVPNC